MVGSARLQTQAPDPALRSLLSGIAWPSMPSERGASLLALLQQLDQTQWWTPEQLLECQLVQIEALLRHAYDTVPLYRERLGAAGWQPGQCLRMEEFRQLPLLTRRDVQSAGAALHSRALHAQFGDAFSTHTSGSSGEPVTLRATELDRLLWEAFTLRDHDWHGRDFSGRLASIRTGAGAIGVPPNGSMFENWGPPVNELYASGPAFALSSNADIAVQVRWLAQHRPNYLITYPSNLAELIDYCATQQIEFRGLRELRTTGETLSGQLRAHCQDVLGVPLTDLYSSQECGYLALQCPQADHYHVMAESVLIEILDDTGRPCAAGETGQVVVTVLHNFASPLIRYQLNDHAEVGRPCACGRGLPTLARIRGRSRNLVRIPDGTRHWPQVGFYEYREVAPVQQYQMVQHSLEEIELRLVTERVLSAEEEAKLVAVVQRWLQYPFRVRFTYYDGRIPRGPGGKFEDFVSLVA